MSNLMR